MDFVVFICFEVTKQLKYSSAMLSIMQRFRKYSQILKIVKPVTNL